MATGFQGFLQGFAEGGANIISTQDKATQAAALFEAEHQRQKQIDAEWEAKKQANTVAQQQAAVAGPQTDTNSTATPVTPTTSPTIGSGVTPIDPTSSTVAPVGPVSTSSQTPASDSANPIPPAGPSASPIGVAASPQGQAVAKVQVAANAQGATPVAGANNLDDILAAQGGQTPTQTPVTPSERAAVLADLTIKHGKDITPSTDQLNAMAIEKRTTTATDNQKNSDAHNKTMFEMGQKSDGTSVYAPDVDFAQVHGVPVLDAHVNDGQKLNPDKIDKIQTTLSTDNQKATIAAEKITQDVATYKQLLADTSTGGVANAAKFFRDNISPNVQIMNGVTKDLVLSQVGQGTGFNRVTNQEMNMLTGGTANSNLTGPAATALLNKIQAQANLAKDYTTYKSDYFGANNRLTGADSTFQQYLKANPIFAPGSTSYEPNPTRQSYKDYFYPGKNPDGSTVTAPTAVDAGIAAAKNAKAAGLTQGQSNAAAKLGF